MSHEASEWVWRHSPYPAGAMLLLHLAIGRIVGKDRVCTESTTALAEDCRCSRRWIVTALSVLTEDGYLELIERGGGRGKPSRYRLLTPETVKQRVQPVHSKPERNGEASSPLDVAEFTVSEPSRAILSPSLKDLRQQKTSNDVELPLDAKGSIEEIFTAWQKSTGHERAVLDVKRRRLIANAIKSHGVGDVLDAVRGWERSPFHRGENERGHVYNGLELVLRDAAHIEQMRDLARSGSPIVRSQEWLT